MPSLPSGTVTLLFTDIEGSTQLLHQLGDDYADLLDEHRRLMREAFGGHGGVEVDTQGDAFFVAFPRAQDAVAAAVEAQRAFAAHDWPGAAGPRVRMAIHSGEPSRIGEGLVGLSVHRAARICSAGHGGQVLLSATTRDLVDDHLPSGVALVDLGEHRLKDLDRPERIANAEPFLPRIQAPKPGLDDLRRDRRRGGSRPDSSTTDRAPPDGYLSVRRSGDSTLAQATLRSPTSEPSYDSPSSTRRAQRAV